MNQIQMSFIGYIMLCNLCKYNFILKKLAYVIISIQSFISHNLSFLRSHYRERVFTLDFQDAATPRSGHSDVVMNYLQKHVFAINHPLIQFLKTFIAVQV